MTAATGTTGYLAIVGPGEAATAADRADALAAGRWAAERGIVVLTGGLGGVMGAAADGVAEAGGTSIALLPGDDRGDAHPSHRFVLPTGLGELRNGLLVRAADAVLAIGWSWGTASEVALARRTGVPVVTVRFVPPADEPEPGQGWPVRPTGDLAAALSALADVLPSAG